MIKINLLPHKKVKPVEKGVMKLRLIVFAVTVVVVLGLAYGWYVIYSSESDLTEKESLTSAQLESLKKKITEVEGYEKSRVDLERKLSIIKQIEKQKVQMTPMLNEINSLVDRNVWLTSLKVAGPVVSIEGMVRESRQNAEAFAARMEKSLAFTAVNLTEVKDAPDAAFGVKTFSFKLTCRMEGYEAPASPAQKPGVPGAKK